MPNPIAPFNAARLVDERYQVELPLFKVDTTSKESLLESVEAIAKSSFSPEQIKTMLGVVKAKAGEMLTEEECDKLFKDIESTDTPLTVKLEAEGNYGLIFEALDQLTANVEAPTAPTNEEATKELEVKIEELNSQVSEKDAKIEELSKEIEKLKAEMTDPELYQKLQTENEQLKSEKEANEQTIATLREQLARYAAMEHDMLVKEAARLAIEARRGISKGKSFEELCDLLAGRSDESLSDMIEDCKLELESATEPNGADTEEGAEEPAPGGSEPVVEQVLDPTIPNIVPNGIEKPTVESVADQLDVTEDEKSTEVYRLVFSEDEMQDIFGN